MMQEEKKIEKMFYGIQEVASLLKVNASLLRFWEKEFDTIRPKKNKKGDRFYTPSDIENLKLIYHLVKEKGFTIQGAKEKLKHNKPGTEKELEIAKSLQKLKSFLLELKSELSEKKES